MVAIILVNWNGWKDTVECLNSLIPALSAEDHIYVVDNASTDGSVGHIQTWLKAPRRGADWKTFEGVLSYATEHACAATLPYELRNDLGVVEASADAQITLLAGKDNLGFAGGNNLGLKLALSCSFDAFWLLNTDTVVHKDALSQMLLRLRLDQHCGMVGSTLLYYNQPCLVQALGGGRLSQVNTSVSHIGEGLSVEQIPDNVAGIEQETAYVVGASILATRAFVETVGLMQDDYFLYFEEIDWAMRGRHLFTIGYAAASRVFHKVGASSAKVVSTFSLNLLYRNRIRFASRFMPHALAATLYSLRAELLRHVIKGRWTHARILWQVLCDRHRLIASAPVWHETNP
jgi:GT2 family glycosyltransferase